MIIKNPGNTILKSTRAFCISFAFVSFSKTWLKCIVVKYPVFYNFGFSFLEAYFKFILANLLLSKTDMKRLKSPLQPAYHCFVDVNYISDLLNLFIYLYCFGVYFGFSFRNQNDHRALK